MPEPKADPPTCDVPGCGSLATQGTDGTEKDAQNLGRKAVPNLNVCDHHENWPFSQDAKQFALTRKTQERK